MKRKGLFIMVDGIDGSGKGTIVHALGQWAKKQGLRILDLREFNKKHHSLPEPEDLKQFDVILSAEPTFSLVGRAIREEIIRHNKREYSALATAQAFALDRYILYKRVIIPALKQGKYIFQERGVTSSIAYQPIQKEHLPLSKILALEGNQLALRHSPNLLIITDLKPELAIERLGMRDGKRDESIFEHLSFLKKLKKRYDAPWFSKIFIERGSKVVFVDTNGKKEETLRRTMNIWSSYLKS